jgi:hypothetical protein
MIRKPIYMAFSRTAIRITPYASSSATHSTSITVGCTTAWDRKIHQTAASKVEYPNNSTVTPLHWGCLHVEWTWQKHQWDKRNFKI